MHADEVMAARLAASRDLDGERLLQLVEQWLRARGPLADWGAMAIAERGPAARAVGELRRCLRDVVAARKLEPLSFGSSLDAIYLWDKLFGNPLSVANLGAPAPSEPASDPVHRALFEPIPPRVADAGAAIEAQDSGLTRVLAALWLVNVPPHAVTPADRERFVAHATSICGVLPPLPMPIVAALAHGLTINAFRAAYGGGNTAPALAAIGRFIAEAMQRSHPRFARRPRPRVRTGKLRVGYVSSCFRRHAVTAYMANRITCRDRDRFEVTVFAVGGNHDEVTDELAASADAFVRLDPYPIERAADAIVRAQLDLLVHCDIGMNLPTHLLAGLYLAPRQIALMGHATTTGMPTITHYLSGDHEPADADSHYSERLIRLPQCGAAQRRPPLPRRRWTRGELGIPDDAIVLANFGHGLKHNAARDALYAEILARVPRAHLVLKPFFGPAEVDPQVEARLRALGPRVTIVPGLDHPGDLIGLYDLADLQIDTFPFGGWTTNLDALHAGVPIVSQAGETGRERWGVRFLEIAGVAVGRARTDREYIEAAVALASNDALRHQVAAQIRAASAPLFEGSRTQSVYERTLLAIIDNGEDTGLEARNT